jgi:hypothetical protein
VWFDIPLLRSPKWLSVFNASDEQITELKYVRRWMAMHSNIITYNNTFTGFKPFELDKVERNIKMIEDNKYNGTDIDHHARDLKEFFTEHDNRRNQDFVKTFPELADWYRNIK